MAYRLQIKIFYSNFTQNIYDAFFSKMSTEIAFAQLIEFIR